MRRRDVGKLLVGLHLRARIALALALGGSFAAAAEPARHPLDPLSAVEIRTVFEVLDAAGHAEETTFYPTIRLDEPDKDAVLAWTPEQRAGRRAFVVVMKREGVFEAVVDLERRRLAAWTEVPGVQPAILLSEEWALAQEIVRAHPPWREALARRGVAELDRVIPMPLTVGFFGDPREKSDRVVKVVAFDGRGADNFWARPIEGLVALVSLQTQSVVDLLDTGSVPIPDGPVDLDPAAVGPLRPTPSPVGLQQPAGPGYRLDGHFVDWQRWRFHWRVDPRLGVVLSLVGYRDGGRTRSVLYQASLSEMFVPYTDPGPAWYFRGFMDAGEYGIGRLLSPLAPGRDCPPHATFLDALLADEYANANPRPAVVCLFERVTGDVAWRHHEALTGATESRRATELVLRSVPAVGNYDYVLDWIFRQDASLEVAVGATGVPQVQAVADGGVSPWGRRVAANTLAVDHDHFFSFRLDFDVDGRDNRLRVDRLRPVELAEGSSRRTSWRVEPRTPERELDARLTIDLARPALWRVVNPARIGANGHPASYQLAPGTNTTTLFGRDDVLRRRAGFTDHHLWVTPWARRERHAAGDYPNQSRGGDGLPSWVERNRPIADTDLVLWYTMAMHHVVRSEDWPVMPVSRQSFQIRPFDFFDRNPALGLPE